MFWPAPLVGWVLANAVGSRNTPVFHYRYSRWPIHHASCSSRIVNNAASYFHGFLTRLLRGLRHNIWVMIISLHGIGPKELLANSEEILDLLEGVSSFAAT